MMDSSVMELRLKEWIPIFEAQAQSGLNKQDWCEQNGIKRGLFFKRQRECRNYLLSKEQVNDYPVMSEATPTFVELNCPGLTEPKNSNADMGYMSSSICLSVSGINITLNGAVDEMNLTKVLKVVSHVY